MDDVYNNIEKYNPESDDDMIPDMISNKKLNPIVTELFIRTRKLNISLVFITQSNFVRYQKMLD